jgi:hypothetical protein
MMHGFGGGSGLEFYHELFICQERFEKGAQMGVAKGLCGSLDLGEHRIDVMRGLGQKVGYSELSSGGFAKAEDPELQDPLEFIDLAVDLDHIVLFKEGSEIRGFIPHPSLDFPGSVGKAQGKVGIPGLGFADRFFLGQKKSFDALPSLELIDEDPFHLSSLKVAKRKS